MNTYTFETVSLYSGLGNLKYYMLLLFFDKDFFLINCIVWEKASKNDSLLENILSETGGLLNYLPNALTNFILSMKPNVFGVIMSQYCFKLAVVHKTNVPTRHLLPRLQQEDKRQGPLKAAYLPKALKKVMVSQE